MYYARLVVLCANLWEKLFGLRMVDNKQNVLDGSGNKRRYCARPNKEPLLAKGFSRSNSRVTDIYVNYVSWFLVYLVIYIQDTMRPNYMT